MSCATPVAPSGGTPDRTGPVVVDTNPRNGTTNFSDNRVSFTFDKFVDRNTFRQNVSIEPDLGIEFDINFRRRTATVSFENELPENTTVVVKVGVDVTDTNRNKMAGSFDLALSTGDVLDNGEVTALLQNAETGRRESSQRVFLYREPSDFSQRANYVAQTDTSGRVNFGYLSEGTYRAIWISDTNRNRIWDRGREQAQVFNEETFELGRGERVDLGTLFYSMPDTLNPQIDGVGLLSERRLRLRLSEPIIWDDTAMIDVLDTLGNSYTSAWPLYTSESDSNVVFAQSEEAFDENQFYTLNPNGFSDKAGNSVEIAFSPFQGSSEPDTTGLQTISHNSGSGLFPDEPLEVKYSKFIDDDTILDSLRVVEGDQMFDDWSEAEIDKHILRIHPSGGQWQSGVQYEFRVWNPWESEYERINPEIWQRNQLGGIEVTVENGNSDIVKVLRITDTDQSIAVDTTFTERIEIDNLPPLEYNVIVFEDENENGKWDFGSVDPFQKPEPYAIQRRVPVREGFTSDLSLKFPDSLQVSDIDEEQADTDANEANEIEEESND